MNLRSGLQRVGWGVLLATTLSSVAVAASDPLVEQLRTDLRTLEREVRELSRRVDQLQTQSPPVERSPVGVMRRSTAPDPSAWIAPEKWEQVRSGMTAQQVILVLGTPVSMRTDDAGVQTLFYTLPIGDGGFLTGTIRLRDDAVLDVQKPTLKP